MKMRIENPGVMTTVQDEGRYGYMKAGVRTGGAMDQDSYHLANHILGNDASAAELEMTLMGITAVIEEDGIIALTGAEMDAKLDGIPIERDKAITVRAGQELSMGMAKSGCRSYLAIAGGIDVPVVMGSRSTDVKCRIGGYEGRALKAGDVLQSGPVQVVTGCSSEKSEKSSDKDGSVLQDACGKPRQEGRPAYRKSPAIYDTCPTVRVVEGPQADWFSEEERTRFYSEQYTVSAESDRMGMRLEGHAVESPHGVDIVSDGIAFGSIQITKSGMPIIMMADHQTTGGYAKIGTVCSYDLPRLAQLRPGDHVNFCRISVEEAQRLYCHPEERNRTATLALPARNKGNNDRSGASRRHHFQKYNYYYRHG